MPDTTTADGLAALIEDWQPPTVRMRRRVDPWQAGAFAALVDAGTAGSGGGPAEAGPDPADGRVDPGRSASAGLDEGDPLPPLWHWLYLIPHPATAEIGADGHPLDGPQLPPIPGRRRMFAGSRLQVHGTIPIGSELVGTTDVTGVTPKTGRSGEMLFVTTRTALTVDGGTDVVAVEEQDIVYRSEPEGAPVRVLERPAGGEPEPDGAWTLRLPTGPVLLSRFSALTYNGHRIHYDQPYATGVEGYPDLVIQGPLMALLALELPRRHAPDERVTGVEFRLSRPAFSPAPIVAAGTRDGDTARIAVAASGAAPSLTVTVRFG